MSCSVKIKENAANFTETDQKIATFFQEHPAEAVRLSAQEIGGRTATSAAAVIRFIKKLNYRSLNEARVELSADLAEGSRKTADLIIRQEDSARELAIKMQALIQESVDDTLAMLHYDTLKDAIDLLRTAQTIYFFGVGASGLVAYDFYRKLSRINKRCVHDMDSSGQIVAAVHTTPQDAAIIFSYSGKTREVLTAARRVRQNGTPCIAVTRAESSALTKLADIVLKVPGCEPEIRLGAIGSRYAELLIADLLFAGIAQTDFEQMKKYLTETRQAINEFNK